jgi:hypothetical protein
MMKTIEYKTQDKSGWGDGPWHNEPDKIQWQDPATGLPCLLTRHPELGHLCGYVGVPEGHPLYGKDWQQDDVSLYAHGGVNFSRFCEPDAEETGICHIPELGEPDNVWWFGFDCAHSGDLSPVMEVHYRTLGLPRYPIPQKVYRDLEYVKQWITFLATQLKEVEHDNSNG